MTRCATGAWERLELECSAFGVRISFGLRLSGFGFSCRCSLILLLLVCGCGRASDSAKSKTEPPPLLVAVAPVEERSAVVEQTFVGTVLPLRTAVVASPAEGQVVEFLARKGSCVKAAGSKGAVPLARLRTNEAALEIAGAVAELDFRQHELEEAKLSAPRETEQAKARKDAAEAVMNFAESRLNRAQKLHHERMASEEEWEEVRSAAEGATKLYAERKAAWELVDSGLWAEKLAQAKAKVDVQKRRIERLCEDLAQREIYAPFDGYVTEEHVEVGEWVAAGGRIAEIVEIDEVYVEVAVFESSISQLRVGTRAEVEIEALTRRSFTGEVAAVVPKADLQSRSFPVRVRLKNPASATNASELLFKPGMFARVRLPVKSKTMLSIPKDSLVLGEALPFVWVIEQDSTTLTRPAGHPLPSDGRGAGGEGVWPKRVSVEVALEGPDDLRADILGPRDKNGILPLKPGQWVVVEGNERITSGRLVKVVKR